MTTAVAIDGRPKLKLSPYREPIAYSLFAWAAILWGSLFLWVSGDSNFLNRLIGWNASGPAVGQLALTTPNARVRLDENWVWYDVGMGSSIPIFDGETIFTNEQGTALLSISGNAKIQILPNTLFIVKFSESRSPTDLLNWLTNITKPLFGLRRAGTLKVDLQQGRLSLTPEINNAVELALGNRSLSVASSLKGGSLTAAFDPASPLESASLDADFESHFEILPAGESRALQLGAREKASFAQDGRSLRIAASAYRPLNPSNFSTLLATEEARKSRVSFRWEWTQKPTSKDKAKLEIEGSERLSVDVTPSGHRAILELSPGSYRWRLSLFRENRWQEDTWSSFKLEGLEPPHGLGPIEGLVIGAEPSSLAHVSFHWLSTPPGTAVEVEVINPSTHKRLLLNGSSEGVETGLSLGRYLWRARTVVNEGGRASPWTSQRSLLIEGASSLKNVDTTARLLNIPPPPLPKAVALTGGTQAHSSSSSPSSASDLSKSGGDSVKAMPSKANVRFTAADMTTELTGQIQWHPVRHARKYHLRVFHNGKTVQDTPFDKNVGTVQISHAEDGDYTYRVDVELDNGPMATGTAASLTPVIPPPALAFPMPGASVDADRTVLLSWAVTPFTASYEIQIADNPRFESPVVIDRVLHNLKRFKPPTERTYYWRVQSLGRQTRSEWSEVRQMKSEGKH